MSKQRDKKLLPDQKPHGEKKALSSDAKKLIFYVAINSVILMSVYFYFINIGFNQIMLIYMAFTAAFTLAYIIYNRAFTRKGLTEDMLTDDWSDEKKREFIQSGKDRLKKSRWMLTILIPMIFTFFADWITLFLLPYLENFFSGQ